VTVEISSRQVRRGDELIELMVYEFCLLRYFLEHPDCVLTKDAIRDRVWSDRSRLPVRVVDWYVHRLRIKLEPDPLRPRHFLTLGWGSYKFVNDPQTTLRGR
jgi:DNA-binding response OmpR family regulator